MTNEQNLKPITSERTRTQRRHNKVQEMVSDALIKEME